MVGYFTGFICNVRISAIIIVEHVAIENMLESSTLVQIKKIILAQRRLRRNGRIVVVEIVDKYSLRKQ